ncbi:hypothetical protein Glove_264g25 [Diversispora epigaea]|uniref:BTB domain-containing protein n=1 Tax=Diversispora epigaea TaxID=1348612 RepID=A0A397I5W3_9GLOM|nr:hypothetical protein Glove_264g25 [Diversispora epigaea]
MQLRVISEGTMMENNEKSFTAHSNILKCRSPYFRKELENIQPNKNNIKTIKSNVSIQNLYIILKYIYGGIFNLENKQTRFIFDLMLTANEFELKKLFSLILKLLESYCNHIIAKHPDLIFDSSDFTSLPESALVSILKRDDLQTEEVKIWDYVIKWEISQNPTLPTNLEEWSKENFFTLKTTLLQLLPLILPDQPVKSNILPARSVLVTESPPHTKEPLSTIIFEEYAAEISTWIDRKTINYSTTNIPYKFELILSGTRDRFDPQTFWNICHGYAKTVVVIKVKRTGEILGGCMGTVKNSILSRVKRPEKAIWYRCKEQR